MKIKLNLIRGMLDNKVYTYCENTPLPVMLEPMTEGEYFLDFNGVRYKFIDNALEIPVTALKDKNCLCVTNGKRTWVCENLFASAVASNEVLLSAFEVHITSQVESLTARVEEIVGEKEPLKTQIKQLAAEVRDLNATLSKLYGGVDFFKKGE